MTNFFTGERSSPVCPTGIRVLVLGNNLNQAVRISGVLADVGWQAEALTFCDDLTQDKPEWWNEGDTRLFVRELPIRPQNWSLSRKRRRSLKELRRIASGFDILLVREDFVGMLAAIKNPIVFWAQGADIQLRPYAIKHEWQELFRHMPQVVKASPGTKSSEISRRRRIWQIPWNLSAMRELARFTARVPLLWRRQTAQRQGIRGAAAVIIAPYQRQLALDLGVRDEKIRYLPSISPSPKDLKAAGVNLIPQNEELLDRLHKIRDESEIMILHPTRILLSDVDGTPFRKANEVLFSGLALSVARTGMQASLVVTRKGDPREIAKAEVLIDEMGLRRSVVWIPEVPPPVLFEIMRSPGVVVADQFSTSLPSLGDVGRLAVAAGTPLITSYSGVDDAMFTSPPPCVFKAWTPAMVAQALVDITEMSLAQREQLRARSFDWYQANLRPDAIGRSLHHILLDSITP